MSKKYIISKDNGKFELGNEEDRHMFYDEADAEATLELINDISYGCFVLIDENDTGISNRLNMNEDTNSDDITMGGL